MGGESIFTVQLILMTLAFLVTTSPVQDPNLTQCWCQSIFIKQKSTPDTDARTRECCKQVDKTFNAFMNETFIETPTGEHDKNDEQIVLEEMKPSCFTKSTDTNFCHTMGLCCVSMNMSLRGAGPAHIQMDPFSEW
jgi:hypothetical protein